MENIGGLSFLAAQMGQKELEENDIDTWDSTRPSLV